MTANELKPGMVIKTASGRIFVITSVEVLTDSVEVCGIGKWGIINTLYKDNLKEKNPYEPDYSIDEVYTGVTDSMEYLHKITLGGKLPVHGKLVYRRPKETVLSMQEIAGRFGIHVEQLKIRK